MLALDLDGTLAIDDHQVMPNTRRELKKLHDDAALGGSALVCPS